MLLRASRPVRPRGLAYRRIVVPLVGRDSETSVALAAELASEQGASIIAVVVIELPAELPLEAHMLEEEAQARRLIEEARAIAGSYGVRVRGRVVLVVLRTTPGRRTRLFGNTAEYVLMHASCRVLVDAPSSRA
jgi:nucleotide-binding universal stress UspA family protein